MKENIRPFWLYRIMAVTVTLVLWASAVFLLPIFLIGAIMSQMNADFQLQIGAVEIPGSLFVTVPIAIVLISLHFMLSRFFVMRHYDKSVSIRQEGHGLLDDINASHEDNGRLLQDIKRLHSEAEERLDSAKEYYDKTDRPYDDVISKALDMSRAPPKPH